MVYADSPPRPRGVQKLVTLRPPLWPVGNTRTHANPVVFERSPVKVLVLATHRLPNELALQVVTSTQMQAGPGLVDFQAGVCSPICEMLA